jgi:hypothetical protein
MQLIKNCCYSLKLLSEKSNALPSYIIFYIVDFIDFEEKALHSKLSLCLEHLTHTFRLHTVHIYCFIYKVVQVLFLTFNLVINLF